MDRFSPWRARPAPFPVPHQKGQIHRLGFAPLSCDLNEISQEILEPIFTELLDIQSPFISRK
jgi:hypothetical protein